MKDMNDIINGHIDLLVAEFLLHFVKTKCPTNEYAWCSLSACPLISYDMIREHKDLPWDIDELSMRLPIEQVFTLNWTWFGLSKNPNIITSEFVARNLDNPLDWVFLSAHMPLSAFEENPDWPWDFYQLSGRDDISWDIVSRYPDKPWDYSALSSNRSIDFETTVLQNPDKPWHYISLSYRVSSDMIINHADKPWYYGAISHKPFPIEFIVQHKNETWDWNRLSLCTDYETGIRTTHDTLPWKWRCVSRNTSVTFEMVQRDHWLPWDYKSLSLNSNITWDHVESTDFKGGWDFDALSRLVDWSIFRKYGSRFSWNWSILSEQLPVDAIMANRNFDWHWINVSRNPSLRPSHVLNNMNLEWSVWYLTGNKYTDFYAEMYSKLARRHLAAMRIQHEWRKIVQIPSTTIGQRIQIRRIHST